MLFLTAVILSTAVRPGVTRLEKWGIPKPVGILVIFGLVGILLGLLVWATVPVLAEQINALSLLLRQWLQDSPNLLLSRLLDILPENLQGLLPDVSETALTDVELPAATDSGQGEQILVGLAQTVAVAMLTFYWTLESEFVKQLWHRLAVEFKNAVFLLIPLPKRGTVRQLVANIETRVGGYLLGQGVLCLIIGLMAFAAYLLIGLPHALLLAIFAGLLEAVPLVGPFLGAVPAIIIGLSVFWPR